ncbi:hypothetical protein ACFTXM_45135 [Streptomyces sp. NPDC056930]|uniref:hypothetical protein n=1 Tax=Streptomyces sp. NPDC056930 TaxID=3345967 RepID=UPI003639B302
MHAFKLYGIMRPCPELLPLSPQLIYQQVFARDAEEARASEAGGLRVTHIAHFDLGGHEPCLSSRAQ